MTDRTRPEEMETAALWIKRLIQGALIVCGLSIPSCTWSMLSGDGDAFASALGSGGVAFLLMGGILIPGLLFLRSWQGWLARQCRSGRAATRHEIAQYHVGGAVAVSAAVGILGYQVARWGMDWVVTTLQTERGFAILVTGAVLLFLFGCVMALRPRWWVRRSRRMALRERQKAATRSGAPHP